MGIFKFFRNKEKKNDSDLSPTCKADDKINYEITVKKVLDEIKSETETPCIKIELTNHKPSVFESKAGGIGYVPRDSKIPVDSSGSQLKLLVQLECDKIKLDEFPKSGLLQFWIADNDVYGLDFDDSTRQNNFRIIYYKTIDYTVTEDEIKEKVTFLKDTENDENDFPLNGEYGISFTNSKDSMSYYDFRFEKIFCEKFNHLMPDKTIKSTYDLDVNFNDIMDDMNIEAFLHKIGGYPGFTQTDPRDDEKYDFLLLQLDSDYKNDDIKIMWGDSGICNFFINREKLKICDFSDVIYNWDCY